MIDDSELKQTRYFYWTQINLNPDPLTLYSPYFTDGDDHAWISLSNILRSEDSSIFPTKIRWMGLVAYGISLSKLWALMRGLKKDN